MKCGYCFEEIGRARSRTLKIGEKEITFHAPSLLRDCGNEYLKQEQQRRTAKAALQPADRWGA